MATPARADVLQNVSKDLLRSSNGSMITHGWRDRTQYFDGTGYRDAWVEGSRSLTYATYELLSRGDTAYNYFYIQVGVSSTLNRTDYPYRAVPARLRVTANGTGITVVQHSWTKSGSLGVHCTDLGTLALGLNIGFVAAGYGSAAFKTCRGGTKVTVHPSDVGSASASATWDLDHFENVQSAEFDYVVKVPAGYKPNFRVDMWTPYDYYNSYNQVIETFSSSGFDTGTNCRIGARGCPAV